jgi:hypothetical protein
MAGALVPTSLNVLLPLLQVQVGATFLWGLERVLLVKNDERPFHGQADSYITIRPKNQMAEACVLGGGRFSPLVTRRIRCRIWSRYAVDEAGREDVWLCDGSLGHIQYEDTLFNALLGYHPMAPNGTDLLCEPLKLGVTTEPATGDKTEPEWGWSEIEFDVTYLLTMPASN